MSAVLSWLAAYAGDALVLALVFALGVHVERWRQRRARKRTEAAVAAMAKYAADLPPRLRASPIPGHWYMVTDGKDRWPAKHDPKRAGGWTNDDTWEDFDGDVIAWTPIP